MTFANMTPAERTKASALIGLIVVMAFFVIHTMLGALAPKVPPGTPAQPELAQNPGVPPTVSAMPDSGAPALGAPESPEKAFPVHNDTGQDILKQTATLDQAPESDPFIPLRPKDGPAPASKPELEVKSSQPVPVGFGGASLPGPYGSQQPAGSLSGSALATPVTSDPEIRVIGIVEGDQSVATIEVSGKARNVRPGESLAKGYRLESVFGEGIRLRHDKKTYAIRVGNAINEETKTQKQ